VAGRGARMRGDALRGFGFSLKESGADAVAPKEKEIPRLVPAKCAQIKTGVILPGSSFLYTVYESPPRVKREQIPLCAPPRGMQWKPFLGDTEYRRNFPQGDNRIETGRE